jgi:protein TonB
MKGISLKLSFLLSFLFHLLLLLLFLWIEIVPRIEIPSLVEVSFISPPKEERRPSRPPSPPGEKPKGKLSGGEELVELPKRRMEEREPPLLPLPRERKLTPKLRGEGEFPHLGQEKGKEALFPGMGEKELLSPEGMGKGEKEIPPTIPSGKEPGQIYKIEGPAAQRTILFQVLPTYPQGLGKEAKIKVSFTVLPDGTVGMVVPLQKGEPILEDLTLAALRQWRFNPLPPREPQVEQRGIITFIYRLR